MLAIYLLYSGVGLTDDVCTENILIPLVLGIGVTGISYLAYLKAIENVSAVYASLAFFCKPILDPFASFLISGTQVNLLFSFCESLRGNNAISSLNDIQ